MVWKFYFNSFLLLFYISAHMHQIQPTEGCELPKKSVPLATADDIEREIPQLCKSAVEDVLNNQFHASSKSKFGLVF